MRIFIYQAKMV